MMAASMYIMLLSKRAGLSMRHEHWRLVSPINHAAGNQALCREIAAVYRGAVSKRFKSNKAKSAS